MAHAHHPAAAAVHSTPLDVAAAAHPELALEISMLHTQRRALKRDIAAIAYAEEYAVATKARAAAAQADVDRAFPEQLAVAEAEQFAVATKARIAAAQADVDRAVAEARAEQDRIQMHTRQAAELRSLLESTIATGSKTLQAVQQQLLNTVSLGKRLTARQIETANRLSLIDARAADARKTEQALFKTNVDAMRALDLLQARLADARNTTDALAHAVRAAHDATCVKPEPV